MVDIHTHHVNGHPDFLRIHLYHVFHPIHYLEWGLELVGKPRFPVASTLLAIRILQ